MTTSKEILGWEDSYAQEQRDTDAQIALNALKLELSVREDNEHVGSGLGGNPTDLLWMLTHDVKAVGTQMGLPTFSRVGIGEIVFQSPKKPAMMDVRRALTKFLDENYPIRIRVTKEQLVNPSFLRELGSSSLQVKLLIQAVEHTSELVTWLDSKKEMGNKLSALAEEERQGLVRLFLKERALPSTYFQDLTKEAKKTDPMSRMFNRHPVFGPKAKAVSKRYGEMIDQLISPEDKEKLEMCGAFPPHIALFVVRSLIGIERMVSLNLDELGACKFLGEINKDMNEGRNNDDLDDEE